MGRRPGTSWLASVLTGLQWRYDQRVAFVRVRSVRLCHQEIAVGDHRKPFVGDQVFHRVSRGFELDITHPLLTHALKGAARSHADAGNQATVRWPVS